MTRSPLFRREALDRFLGPLSVDTPLLLTSPRSSLWILVFAWLAGGAWVWLS